MPGEKATEIVMFSKDNYTVREDLYREECSLSDHSKEMLCLILGNLIKNNQL